VHFGKKEYSLGFRKKIAVAPPITIKGIPKGIIARANGINCLKGNQCEKYLTI
jgi:hypothetical protein|tara:strand:+ start:471 stop:629 length:159 start_codon:yes stop_codon:yes gene_type:complete